MGVRTILVTLSVWIDHRRTTVPDLWTRDGRLRAAAAGLGLDRREAG